MRLQGVTVLLALIGVGVHLIPDAAERPAPHLKASLTGHAGIIKSIEFSPSGEVLASTGLDKVVRLWNVAAAQEIGAPRLNAEQSLCLAFSPDGKTLATAGRTEIAFWDPSKDDEPKDRWHSGVIYTMLFSADGKSLLTADDEGLVRLWDAARRSASAAFDTNRPGAILANFTQDGIYLASISSDKRARVWNWKVTTEAPPTHRLLPDGDYFDLAFAPDGRRLFAGSRGGFIQEWDVAGERPHRRHDVVGWVSSLAFSPDGRLLAHGNHDGNITVFEPATRRGHRSWSGHSMPVSALAFSPDGRLLASGDSDSSIKIWDVSEISADPPRLALAGLP